MKKWLSIMLLGSGLLANATGAFAQDENKPDRKIAQPLDESACDQLTGQCVAFEVVITTKTVASLPIVRRSTFPVPFGVNNWGGTIVRHHGDKCSKQVHLPKDVYLPIVAVLRSLAPQDGEQPPAFTPAQQTMLLFYTTLMQQTLQFNCGGNNANSQGSGGPGNPPINY